MPPNVVKTSEQERLWDKAKRLAKKQGRAKDYAYIMGIFKQMGAMSKAGMPGIAKLGQDRLWEVAKRKARMVGKDRNYDYVMKLYKEMAGWKSMDDSDLEKSYLLAQQTIPNARVPGQVPDSDTIEAIRLAKEQPKPFSVARLLAHSDPRPTVASIVRDLGMDVAQQNDWIKFLETSVGGATNELILRQDIMSKCLNDRLDGGLRRAILQRSLVHWRGYRKSLIQIVDPDELLQKAETRGGSYHRRVPKPGGGYRYFYDEDKYRKSKGAHTTGEEGTENYVTGKVQKCIDGAGEAGCGPDAFRDLVKQYGVKTVAGVLKKNVDKSFTFQKGKFKAVVQKNDKPGIPIASLKAAAKRAGKAKSQMVAETQALRKKKLQKSDAFLFIPESDELSKAIGHKYISRKKDAKGNWVYTYADKTQIRRVARAILDFLRNPKRDLTVSGTARAFRIDKITAAKMLDDMVHMKKLQKVGNSYKGIPGVIAEGTIVRTPGAQKEFERQKELRDKVQKEEPKIAGDTGGLNEQSTLEEIKRVATAKGMLTFKAGLPGAPKDHEDFAATVAALNPGGKPGNSRVIQYMKDFMHGYTVANLDEPVKPKKPEPKLVIPQEKKPAVSGEQLGLFDRPATPESDEAKTTEEKAAHVEEQKESVTSEVEPAIEPEKSVATGTGKEHPEVVTDVSTMDHKRFYSVWEKVGDIWLVDRSYSGSYFRGLGNTVIPTDDRLIIPQGIDPNKPIVVEPSTEKVKVEVGEHVWGSAKDKWDIFNSSGRLEGLSPDEQLQVTKKSKLLEVKSTETLLGLGMAPGAIVMRRAVEKMIGSTPPKHIHKQAGRIFTSETEMRQAYVDGMDFVAESLDNCKDDNAVVDFVQDWRWLSRGKRRISEHAVAREEMGVAEDAVIAEKSGKRVTVGWKKRDALVKAHKEAYHQQHWASGAAKRKWTKEVDKLDKKMKEARNGLNAHEVPYGALRKLSLTPEEEASEDVGMTYSLSKTEDWTIDTAYVTKYELIAEDLGARDLTTPYQRYGFALGNKMANLSGAKYGGDFPKQFKEAMSLAEGMRNQGEEDQIASLEKYENKKVARGKGKKRSYRWVREVSGEIVREGGEPVTEGTSTSGTIQDKSGVQNIQFGKALTDTDAQAHLDGLQGALLDLADLAGVDPDKIGLKGRLSFGMAARRGSAYAAAHYEPSKKIINLTQKAGGGCVAHEWAHAMDYILAEAHNEKGAKDRQAFRMTNGEMQGLPQPVAESMAGVMDAINYTAPVSEGAQKQWDQYVDKRNRVLTAPREAVGGIMGMMTEGGGPLEGYDDRRVMDEAQRHFSWASVEDSEYVRDCKALSPGGNGYHQRKQEQFAHCFEAYIEDKLADTGRKSSYLVSDTTGKRDTYVYRDKAAELAGQHAQRYPHGEQRHRINKAFDKLMAAVSGTKALEKSLRKFFIKIKAS